MEFLYWIAFQENEEVVRVRKVWIAIALPFVLAHFNVKAAQPMPDALQGIAIQEKLGETASLGQWTFRDEEGKTVRVADFVSAGRPLILNFAYYNCPHLCTLVLNGLKDALRESPWRAGREFEVVTLSIDPREKPELARQKKASYIAALGQPEAAQGWHFLTGDAEQIRGLANEMGFGYRWVEDEKQFAHGAALFLLTPEGRLSRILYGIEFPARDFKLGLVEASQGKIGNVVDRFLLFCYRYDPKTRKYSIVLTQIVQWASAATVLTMGGMIGGYFWRRRKKKGA